MASKMRVDKWLWCVRIFKSRTKATDACKGRKISINNLAVKPSYLVTPGDILQVKKEGFNLEFEVVELLKNRVSATQAEPCYNNLTPQEELLKFKDWFVGKAAPERREKGSGRPTKKDRRTIDSFKNDSF